VDVARASNSLGTILVDGQGMTLYHLSGEQRGKFICTSSACLGVWRPLIAPSSGAPSGEVGSLGTVKRPEGTVQVTYKGTPLYTFTGDQQPGETKGQGIKDVGTWSVVTTSSSGTSPSTSSSSEPGKVQRRQLERRRLRPLSPPADVRRSARGVAALVGVTRRAARWSLPGA
jgi:predicted lipoprotein with Yx(FWY)xxD motif